MLDIGTMNKMTVQEINKALRYNVSISPKIDKRNEITLKDLDELKATRDYIDKLYQKLIQTLR